MYCYEFHFSEWVVRVVVKNLIDEVELVAYSDEVVEVEVDVVIKA